MDDEQAVNDELVRVFAGAVELAIERSGVADAVMLRRVARAREAIRELDDLLETLQRYFTAGGA